MNPVFFVIATLSLLMYLIGLNISIAQIKNTCRDWSTLSIGLIAQLLILPTISLLVSHLFNLDSFWTLGLLIIACSPGGSSSNILTHIAKGNVELSVTLTTLSTLLSLITIPMILGIASHILVENTISWKTFSLTHLTIQNILLSLVPILLGVFTKHFFPKKSIKISYILNKTATPAFLLIVISFFIQNYEQIANNITEIGIPVLTTIIFSMTIAILLAKSLRVNKPSQKAIAIEVGIQNAAQAIAIAISPFIFNNSQLAIPAIIYSLLMNIIIMVYILLDKQKQVLTNK